MSQTAESCERTEVWINRWLDREISAEENTAFTRHMQSCAQCGREFRMARGLERLLSSIEAPPAVSRKLETKKRISTVLRASVSGMHSKTVRPQWGRAAIAAAALLSILGIVASQFVINTNTGNVSVQPQLPSEFHLHRADRMAVLEALNRNALSAAAVQPGALAPSQMARVHEDLADELTAALLLRNVDSETRHDAAISYIRTLQLALIPDIRNGVTGLNVNTFSEREGAIRSVDNGQDAAIKAAQTASENAVAVVMRKQPEMPGHTIPFPGKSLIAMLSETSLAMREKTSAADRAELLNIAAERLNAELTGSNPDSSTEARLIRIELELSSALVAQIKLIPPGAPAKTVSLLLTNSQRLASLRARSAAQSPELRTAIDANKNESDRIQKTLSTEPSAKPQENKQSSDSAPAKGAVLSPVPANAAPASAQPLTSAVVEQDQKPALTAPAAAIQNAPAVQVPVFVPGKSDEAQLPNVAAAAHSGLQTKPSENSNSGKHDTPTGSSVKGVDSPQHVELAAEHATRDLGNVDHPDKGAGAERPETAEHPDKVDRPDRPVQADQIDHPGSAPGRSLDRPQKTDLAARPEQPERPEHPDIPDRPDHIDTPVSVSGNGNSGNGGNQGNGNAGNGNTSSSNSGNKPGTSGNGNSGNKPTSSGNAGNGNSGNGNSGNSTGNSGNAGNQGNGNAGNGNSGNGNSGNSTGNSGNAGNQGNGNAGNGNSGNGNSGNSTGNSGNAGNQGNGNVGSGNSNSSGTTPGNSGNAGNQATTGNGNPSSSSGTTPGNSGNSGSQSNGNTGNGNAGNSSKPASPGNSKKDSPVTHDFDRPRPERPSKR